MSVLPAPSVPSLPSSVFVLLSEPGHWGAWAVESGLSRLWRQEQVHAQLQPMREQLLSLSVAMEEASRTRRGGATARKVVQAAVEALEQAVRSHQQFLQTLDAAWQAMYEFPAYQALLRSYRLAIQAWQQAVCSGDALESERFRHCERLGWRLLGEAALMSDMFVQAAPGGQPQSDGQAPNPGLASGWRQRLLQAWRQWLSR